MPLPLPQSLEPLTNTPRVLRALLSNLSAPWITTNYGENTFTPFDVVGHLIEGEKTDWIPRIRHILAHGAARPFEPFGRYAMYESSRGSTIAELLDEFTALRAQSLAQLRALNLTDSDLARPGLHPALGPVTLGNLLATWVAHDLHHIAQITKCMALQFADPCGPWRAYISILTPPPPPPPR